jgi:predicted DNA binding protein
MVVITDIAIPSDQFALGQLLEAYPDIAIELERLVPLREGIIPLFWVEGGELGELEATIRSDPLTVDVAQLTELDGRYLFEITWSADVDALVQPLIESGAEVLRATGTVDLWEFRLQFRNRADLAVFRERCVDNDVDIRLQALYNPSLPELEPSDGLTPEQYDILATAHEYDYFHIPRGIELGEIADLIGISPNAASQRMRRALDYVVADVVRAGYD